MLSLEDEEKYQITLVSNNKITEQRFTLSKKAASLSGFLKIVMKGDPDVSEINVDVEADILKKIVEYLVNHDGIPSNKIEPPLRTVNLDTIISPWDFTFIEEFDKDNLITLKSNSNPNFNPNFNTMYSNNVFYDIEPFSLSVTSNNIGVLDIEFPSNYYEIGKYEVSVALARLAEKLNDS